MGYMSTFSESDVAKLAEVACIQLDDEELKQFAKDLADITGTLTEVQDTAASSVAPTHRVTGLTNVLRPDLVTEVLDRAELLASAPDTLEGQFVVPQILEEA